MDPWYAVGLGMILTWCGYELGKQRGFRDGIELTVNLLMVKGLLTEEQLEKFDFDDI